MKAVLRHAAGRILWWVGFTMAEVIVALAIMAVLGGILIPRIAGYLDSQRISSTATIVADLGTSISRFKTAVGYYPGALSQLTTPILAGAPGTGDETDCHGSPGSKVTYSSTQATNWVNNGPGPYYTKAMVKAFGLQLPIGMADDRITRSSNNKTAGFISITVPNVSLYDARDLNTAVDGTTDVEGASSTNSVGTIRYTAPASTNLVSLTINFPVGFDTLSVVGC
jgi:prepilin-type N-terminal cleavage/methylation domain-containing protein